MNFSASKLFFWSLIVFLIGIAVGSVSSFNPRMVIIAGVVGGASIVFVGASLYFKKKIFLFGIALILVFLGGVLRASQETAKVGKLPERDFSGNIQLVKDPEIKFDYQKLTGETAYSEKVIIFADKNISYDYGEVLAVDCKLKNPENKYEKFNYQKYLAKSGIYQICSSADIVKTEKNEGNSFLRLVFKAKKEVEKKIAIIFPKNEGGYLSGLLLGGDERMSEKVADDFQKTGTTHTVAVSGHNITIIAMAAMQGLIFVGFWRKQAFWLALISVWLFVLMIGFPASAVRAGLVGSLVLIAANLGRLSDSIHLLALAGAVICLFSPLSLIYDAGFQLSFLASLGIVLFYAPIRKKFNIENDFLELKSIFLVTLSAQIAVFGLSMYLFETFSLVSFVVNLIILPAIPVIMLGGFIVVSTSFILPLMGRLVAYPVWLMLRLELWSVSFFAEFSRFNLNAKSLGIGWLAVYYLFFIALAVRFKKNVVKL